MPDVSAPPPSRVSMMARTVLSRRNALAGLAASGLVRAARAQPAVFLDYTQDELDRCYDQQAWAPNAGAVLARYAADSAAVRQATPPRTERYGDGAMETLDIFASAQASGAPVIVFLHGGAWLRLTRADASAPAPAFMARGAVWVAPDFANAQQAPLAGMADQCRRAVAWVVRNAASFGGDPARVVIAGHSSGGHLAGTLLTTDWTALGLPPNAVSGALLMSGIYDLFPVALSSRQRYLHVSALDIEALSPLRHLDRVRCPVCVNAADQDSPEFKRQSAVMADALAGMGRLVSRATLFNTNHFEAAEQLGRPGSVPFGQAMTLLGLD